MQETFHCRLESTSQPTGGVSTISRVNCRQAGVAEGLARCQGEEAEYSGTGEGRG